MRRTMLFLPGNSPNMIVNGGFLGSDRIILDLEDAVSPDQKDAARELTAETLRCMKFPGCQVIVRMNGMDTPYWREDLERILSGRPDFLMPPKVGDGEEIKELDRMMGEMEEKHGIKKGSIGLIPLIETARGVENSYRIACSSGRIEGLFLGAEDLTSDLRCARTKKGDEIAYARSRILYAARAAGVEAYDSPFTDVEDMEGLRRDTELAKSLGFSGKAAVNPRQVECINEVFSPTQQEIDYARDVVAAAEAAAAEGKGVISLRGKMIDAPILNRAKTVLQMARALGMKEGEET